MPRRRILLVLLFAAAAVCLAAGVVVTVANYRSENAGVDRRQAELADRTSELANPTPTTLGATPTPSIAAAVPPGATPAVTEPAATTTTPGSPAVTVTTGEVLTTSPAPHSTDINVTDDGAEAAIASPPVPSEGTPVGVLSSPVLGDWQVARGASPATLTGGPGVASDVAIPGQPGVTPIAGHRTSHRGPFRNIPDLPIGGDLTFTRVDGVSIIYTVRAIQVVPVSDLPATLDAPPGDPTASWIALFACSCEDGSPGCVSHRVVAFLEATGRAG